ncbi:MAG TPA: L,D-transpeptidase family protein [Longimicrobiales bacterium]|nr:L,D-transpeptidase family protein [Longimicrobiales bacterium]
MTSNAACRRAFVGVALALGVATAVATAAPATAAQVPDVTRAPGELPDGEVRLVSSPLSSGFITEQLRFLRVQRAMDAKREGLAEAFAELGLEFPPAGVYVRVFKAEREVEVWVRGRGADRYVRLRRYPICQVSGALGPKRMEGDRQMPEGFYEIESFNPQSDYHLSLRVNYPNSSDRRLGRSGRLGGDIYLHGGCSTVGCVPVTDEHIRELYWLSVEARAAGLRRIPVHIFPTRMDAIGMAWLQPFGDTRADLGPFWRQLKAGYDFFERHHRVPGVIVEADGAYSIVDAGSPEGFSRRVRPARKSMALLGTPVDAAATAAPEEIVDEVQADALPVPALTGRTAAAVASTLLGSAIDAAEEARPDGPTGVAAAEAEDGPRLLGEPVDGPVSADASPTTATAGVMGPERTTAEAGEWLTEEDLGEPRPALLGQPMILGQEIAGGPPPPGANPITLPGFEVREAEAIPGRMPYRPPRLRVVRPAF